LRKFKVLALAAGLLVATIAPAYADPITEGIAAIASWVTAGAINAGIIGTSLFAAEATFYAVSALAYTALAAGLQYVSSALQGAPKANNGGNSGKISTSGIIPRTFLAGYGMTAGKLAYVNTWGKDGKTPNAYLSMVISLSDLPVDSLQGLIVNDAPATYGSGSPDAALGYAIPEFSVSGTPYLWVKFYDGTQTTADSHLVSTFGSDPNFPYSSARVGHGVAYAIVTARLNQNLFSGFPTFKFILNGCKFYDPRKDTSVGGDGSHRFDDQSTWEFTQNPKVIEYNILRGITYGGTWFYGLQNLAASRLPLSSWVAAMNECDLEVDNNAGGTEPQYRCGGEIAVNVTPADAIAELEKCCNGRLAEIGGIYKTICGAAGSAVYSISDGDLLTTDQQTFNQFPGLSDLINAITASYPDPAQGWELSPAPGRYSDDLEADDGDRQLISDVQYNMVPYAEQVQRLMQSALDEARRFRKHTIPLPPSAWALEPLDFISWTSNRNGYDSKLFRIDLATDMASLEMVLVITEVDPSDYDWNPEADFIPVNSGPLVIAHPPAQSIVGWDAEGVTITGDGGVAAPGIELEWSTTDIDDVDGIIFQVRLASDSSIVLSGETTHSIELFQTGNVIISQNIVRATDYQVRGKYRPISTRDTEWSSWLDVTTPDVGGSTYDGIVDRLKLSDDLKNLNDFVGQGLQDVLSKIRNLSQAVAETGFGASCDMQTIRQSLSSTAGNLKADYTSLIQAVADETEAFASDIETLQAALSGYTGSGAVASAFTATNANVTTNAGNISANTSDITELQATLTGYSSGSTVASAISSLSAAVSSQGGDITANADAITALTATQGNFSASGLFRVGVETTMSGAQSTIGLSVAATGGGASKSASLFLNAMSDGTSQIVAVADKFIVTDGTHTGTPFLFDGSTLYVSSAVIPTITSDKLDVGVINVSSLIADDVIVTGHLQAGSVTNVQANQSTSGAPSISITTTGGPVLVNTCLDINQSGGVGTIQITRGGSGIGNTIRVVAEADGGGIGALMIVDTPSAGTYTYSVAAVAHCSINKGTITAIELKR
jgi:hypothetical protein